MTMVQSTIQTLKYDRKNMYNNQQNAIQKRQATREEEEDSRKKLKISKELSTFVDRYSIGLFYKTSGIQM